MKHARVAVLGSCIALLAIIGLARHIPEELPFTGDEPRYLLFSLSLAIAGKPLMTPDRYEEFRKTQRADLPVARYGFDELQGGARKPGHPIAFPLLVAPLTPFASVAQVRLVSLLLGMLGLWFLLRLILAQQASFCAMAAAFVPAVLFFPALPYYFLALPEVLLFLLVAIAFWNLGLRSGESLRAYSRRYFAAV